MAERPGYRERRRIVRDYCRRCRKARFDKVRSLMRSRLQSVWPRKRRTEGLSYAGVGATPKEPRSRSSLAPGGGADMSEASRTVGDAVPRAYEAILYDGHLRAEGRVYFSHARDLFDLDPPAVRAIIDSMVEDGYLRPVFTRGPLGRAYGYWVPTEKAGEALGGLTACRHTRHARRTSAEYRAVDVAREMVQLSIDHRLWITNLQLQAILYFTWVDYYRDTGTRLFDDQSFEAWKYGPVVKDVYYEYWMNLSRPIFLTKEPEQDMGEVSGYLLESLERYRAVTARELADTARGEGSPWDRCYMEGRRESRSA